MKKESIVFIIVVLLMMGCYLIISESNIENSDSNNNQNNQNDKEIKEEDNSICLPDYKCLTINNNEYYFSLKKEISVNEVYDYDNDININGKLYINNSSELVFLNENDNPIKTYDNIDGNVISLDSQTGECNEKFIVILTSTNKVYRTENIKSLLEEEPFYELETDSKITDITLYDKEDYCNNIIYALSEDGNIVNLK